MRRVTTESCVHCAETMAQPAVLAWAYGRPVAAVCEPCVLADASAVPRRLRTVVELRFPDFHEDPLIAYSYRGGPIADMVGDVFVSRTA